MKRHGMPNELAPDCWLFRYAAVAALVLGTAGPPAVADVHHASPAGSEPAPFVATWLRAYPLETGFPGRIAVGDHGRLFVTQPAANRIEVRDLQGVSIETRDGFRTPFAIAVDASGRIYVGEQASGSVTVFDAQWKPLAVLGEGDGEFVNPADIAIDPDPGPSRVHVVDAGAHLVRVYGADGTHQFDFGGRGSEAGQLDFPSAVHFTSEGEVLVGEQLNDRIQVFDRDGSFLRLFGGDAGAGFGRISALTVDAEGRIYVADIYQGEIVVLDSQGLSLGNIGSFGSGPGQLRTPTDLAIDINHRLLVASANNSRIELYGLDPFVDTYVVPAFVSLGPGVPGSPSGGDARLTVNLEIPTVTAGDIDFGSITGNGIPALDGTVVDSGEDGVAGIRISFEAAAILTGVDSGDPLPVPRTFTIRIEGSLLDGRSFAGSATLGAPPRRNPARGQASR